MWRQIWICHMWIIYISISDIYMICDIYVCCLHGSRVLALTGRCAGQFLWQRKYRDNVFISVSPNPWRLKIVHTFQWANRRRNTLYQLFQAFTKGKLPYIDYVSVFPRKSIKIMKLESLSLSLFLEIYKNLHRLFRGMSIECRKSPLIH